MAVFKYLKIWAVYSLDTGKEPNPVDVMNATLPRIKERTPSVWRFTEQKLSHLVKPYIEVTLLRGRIPFLYSSRSTAIACVFGLLDTYGIKRLDELMLLLPAWGRYDDLVRDIFLALWDVSKHENSGKFKRWMPRIANSAIMWEAFYVVNDNETTTEMATAVDEKGYANRAKIFSKMLGPKIKRRWKVQDFKPLLYISLLSVMDLAVKTDDRVLIGKLDEEISRRISNESLSVWRNDPQGLDRFANTYVLDLTIRLLEQGLRTSFDTCLAKLRTKGKRLENLIGVDFYWAEIDAMVVSTKVDRTLLFDFLDNPRKIDWQWEPTLKVWYEPSKD
ncbi:MAG: hypothetical protein V3U84_11665 [Thiotrichaceae bacterium]